MFRALAKKRCGIVLLLLVFGTLCQAGPVWAQLQAPCLEFIYIDAAAGEAAAGHSAIKLGQTVFHYEFHSDGLLLLNKQDWEDFRYFYNDLSNRSLEIAAIPLSRLAYLAIYQSFQDQYLRQQIDLDRRKRLQEEYELFVKLAHGDRRLEIEGLGLFSPVPQTGGQHSGDLKNHVDKSLGREFLAQLLQKTEQQLLPAKDALLLPLFVEDAPPQPPLEFGARAKRLKELLALRESLNILLEERGLNDASLVRSMKTRIRLDSRQRVHLEEFQKRICQSIISLLRTNRSDKGAALLVQIARYQVIGHSLAEGELYTLYPFAKHFGQQKLAPVRDKDDQNFLFLSNEALFFNERTRKTFFTANPSSSDIAYSMLEKSQGKVQLYEQAAGGRNPGWQVSPECGLPCLSEQVSLDFSAAKMQYQVAGRQAQKALELYNRQLDTRYGYNLFSRNCATELVRTINKTFQGTKEIQDTLGGYLQAGKALSYIPFGLHDAVIASFSVQRREDLPSYRLRELKRMYQKEGDEVWLRESNTLTSTLYTPWDKDGYFLFFTDDTLITRPLFGIINLCYGALQVVGGVITAPLDKGERFIRGWDGIIFSLPEIIFINIRKGTFQIIDTTQRLISSEPPLSMPLETVGGMMTRTVYASRTN